jgi:hypothetical protein
MKTKTSSNKLVLKKETIADITSESMKKIQGGDDRDPICFTSTCPTYTTHIHTVGGFPYQCVT